jgi:hypothetical protein
MKLSKPTTALTEVLYELLTKKSISNADLPYMWGFRSRISNLTTKYGIQLNSTMVTSKNKHGRAYSYVQHQLMKRKDALKTYNKLIGNEKKDECSHYFARRKDGSLNPCEFCGKSPFEN